MGRRIEQKSGLGCRKSGSLLLGPLLCFLAWRIMLITLMSRVLWDYACNNHMPGVRAVGWLRWVGTTQRSPHTGIRPLGVWRLAKHVGHLLASWWAVQSIQTSCGSLRWAQTPVFTRFALCWFKPAHLLMLWTSFCKEEWKVLFHLSLLPWRQNGNCFIFRVSLSLIRIT